MAMKRGARMMPTLLILSLLLSLLSLAAAPSPAAGAQAGRIHPLLSKLMDERPDRLEWRGAGYRRRCNCCGYR